MTHGDATFGIPDGNAMVGFCDRIADEPEKLEADAARMVDGALINVLSLAA